MREFLILVLATGLLTIHVNRAVADDVVVNTPVVSTILKGYWKLQSDKVDAYQQSLHLGSKLTGEWQKSRETHPFDIAWFVEGGELRILYYHDVDQAFNLRVKTLMVKYTLSHDANTLTLTLDGKPTTWKRVKETAPAQP
jgi:hypothetical protein